MNDARGTVPEPPRLKPAWTTWMWLALAIAVVVATIVGLWLAGRPMWS